MAADAVHGSTVAGPTHTGIALLSWYCGDVYKCPSLRRLMQGRLFVVPWGKDFFIKALRLFTHACALPEQTGNHSHSLWLQRGLGLLEGQEHLRTLWVSRNRSSVTPLMNPCVIFQLSSGYQAKKLLFVPWQAIPSCPESFLSPEPSPSMPSCSTMPQLSVSSSIMYPLSPPPQFWIVPLLCTVGYGLLQVAIIHTKQLFLSLGSLSTSCSSMHWPVIPAEGITTKLSCQND